MTDLLFIELGAVVTQILGSTRCYIEPFCAAEPGPSYQPQNHFEVDFALLLESHLNNLDEAAYDQIVRPTTASRVAIGPKWPSGGYEGILCVRENKMLNGGTLSFLGSAASELAGPRCRYQVIASIGQGKIRRYHGFAAQIVSKGSDNAFDFKIMSNGQTTGPAFSCGPGNSNAFYTGSLVDNIALDGILNSSMQVDTQGAVFIDLDSSGFTEGEGQLPKLPPAGGL
jgi:hypothetical protein